MAQIGSMFQRISTEAFYEQLLQESGITSSGGIYNVPLLIWLMIVQRLSQRGTAAVAVQEMAQQANQPGPKRPEDCKRVRDCRVSSNIGGYCQARQRLPEDALHGLVRQSGKALPKRADSDWLWLGRPVRVADGSVFYTQLVELFLGNVVTTPTLGMAFAPSRATEMSLSFWQGTPACARGLFRSWRGSTLGISG